MTLYTVLLGSGLDIHDMNIVRKRFSRWGAGRLALALSAARVRNYVVSDVMGDELSTIGSGPCVPDGTTAAAVRRLLTHAGLWERIPSSMRDHLAAVGRDALLETPKPGHAAFGNIEFRIVASNRLALEGAAARAEANGVSARVMNSPLGGEAAEAGRGIARRLTASGTGPTVDRGVHASPVVLVWGGETVVRLDHSGDALGGRCQELALAAARELAAGNTSPSPHFLLAAGTDGRDGPTDAAGAVVHGGTWEAIRRAGRDPGRDLATHNAYRALESVGALVRTGLTGTNVMDIVIGLQGPTEGLPIMSP
jgi:glycerate-2-kinase